MDIRPFGVNVAGHLESEKGMGEAVRATIRTLQEVGFPYAVNNVVDSGSANAHPMGWQRDNPYAINLLQINPEGLPTALPTLDPSYLAGRYNIGYWTWELPEFPRQWVAWSERFDEIWVPSQFVARAVQPAVALPVRVVPHALDVDEVVATGGSLAAVPAQTDRFRFVFMFDYASYWQRKNPLDLIEAFRLAFGGTDHVELILKTSHSAFSPEGSAAVREAARAAGVTLIEALWSRPEVLAFLASCDAVVSLHRAEGFGLVLAEAMALGKPVIATGYSGNLDFMDAGCSLLIRSESVELPEDVGPYPQGDHWAQPDLEHAAAMMRWVVAQPGEAAQIGQRGQEQIRRLLSPHAVGLRVRRHLEGIVTPMHTMIGVS